MRKTHYLLTACLLLVTTLLNAQDNKGTIKGKLVDSSGKQALPLATSSASPTASWRTYSETLTVTLPGDQKIPMSPERYRAVSSGTDWYRSRSAKAHRPDATECA